MKIGPYKIKLSFRILKEKMERNIHHSNRVIATQAKEIIDLIDAHPKLLLGFEESEGIEEHQNVINQVMAYLFPESLTDNEIKCAIRPFSNDVFYLSTRFNKIIDNATNDIDEAFLNMFEVKQYSDFNFIPYAVILNRYYQYKVDISRPLNLRLQEKGGKNRTYRLLNNADFIDIYPNDNAIEITPEILDEILWNAENPAIWEKYFPEGSWTLEGFGIYNLVDTTIDDQLDTFKNHLIEPNSDDSLDKITIDIRQVFDLPNLDVAVFEVDGDEIRPANHENAFPLTLKDPEPISIKAFACDHINIKLFGKKELVIISNFKIYNKKNVNNRLTDVLREKGYKSIILIPITIEEEIKFVLEIGSREENQLNGINALKLEEIIPFIQSYAERVNGEFENQISAVIQRECTSIHPAVQWKFEDEALRFIQENKKTQKNFREIVFEDVIPLYGQVDIVGSSKARNDAIKSDLLALLQKSTSLLHRLSSHQDLPLYQQLIFQTDKLESLVVNDFKTNTEQQVTNFFKHHLHPMFGHVLTSNELKNDVESFLNSLDSDTLSVYESRKTYDTTVDTSNKTLSNYLDKRQEDAQAIFPHYFEKYKTDGIEHNLYIGQSISNELKYHPSVLFNLRLWQLQVMCEMEALYYQEQKESDLPLEIASLIFAYDHPITIRYRIDEKKFDIDGSYNVQYEIIKKRIDKAHIKGTDQRLTIPHHISIVYSNNDLEQEYLKYLEFLQTMDYVTEKIEFLELEELQGASGLKAIRAEINPNLMMIDSESTA